MNDTAYDERMHFTSQSIKSAQKETFRAKYKPVGGCKHVSGARRESP